MEASPVVTNLLLLYAGLILINVGLSLTLWRRSRDVLHRTILVAWAATALSFVVQAVFGRSPLQLAIGFVSVLPINLAFAYLLARASDLSFTVRPYVVVTAIALAASVTLSLFGASFRVLALPVAIAVALPCAITALRAFRRGRAQTTSMNALSVSCLLFAAHNVDWAFLRDHQEFAALGFTLAILIIFALSITAPAVALERITAERARAAAELDAARRIQSKILPRTPKLHGLDVVTHMRPAESVGGDYLDVYGHEDSSWLLVGDVTGHGLGAGLVMLMAQSTISSILRARPTIRPRELAFIANEVLHANLERLEEPRHMTFVAIRHADGRVVVSGSHDDLYVLRAGGSVETIPVQHMPMGLGFVGDIALDRIGEQSVALGSGDLLFVGTDGVTEAARDGDPTKGLFGSERLLALLERHRGRPLDEIRSAIVEGLEEFTAGAYDDDVAFLLARAPYLA